MPFVLLANSETFVCLKKPTSTRAINVIAYVLAPSIADSFSLNFEDCALVVANNWFMVLTLEDGLLYVEDVLVVHKVSLNKGVDAKLSILLI